MKVIFFDGDDPRLQQALAIRRQVFIIGQDVPEEIEMDGCEDRCVHLLAIEDDEGIGTLRLMAQDGYLKVQRVAVLEAWRGKDVGRKLMQAAHDYALKNNHLELRLGAQLSALPFYEKLGYQPFGDVFMDANIPHKNMQITLSPS